jgi:hypothetical protein
MMYGTPPTTCRVRVRVGVVVVVGGGGVRGGGVVEVIVVVAIVYIAIVVDIAVEREDPELASGRVHSTHQYTHQYEQETGV